ncbi:MAG TPA: DUF1800 family protein [Chthoniobacterales bacterium]
MRPAFLQLALILALGLRLAIPAHGKEAPPAFASNPPASITATAAPSDRRLTGEQLASRFLNQATFGATPEEITALSASLAAKGDAAFSDWIDAQFQKPVSEKDLALPTFRAAFPPDYPKSGYREHTHEGGALRASLMIRDNDHPLRRRVAYALSQIFVVCEEGGLFGSPEGMCDWSDLLFQNAFTDFLTLLKAVTYHPVMASYLSLNGNAKAGYYNPGSRPDENYAREVMQLFTIGLVRLNPDGSYVTDAAGRTIPTYDQTTITEMARVFTGLNYPAGTVEYTTLRDGKRQRLTREGNVRFGACVTKEKKHDTEAKSFLGASLPAGQDTKKDIDDTLQILASHPNTAPFISKALIQRLTTSNPSPAYVKRVAETFAAGQGEMKAVVRAILLDEEARDPRNVNNDQFGKLREPWLRVTQLARAFRAQPAEKQPWFPVYARDLLPKLGQFPFWAPSVFNFYLPSFQPAGAVAERNARIPDNAVPIVAPEFQIMNSNTALLLPNYLMDCLEAQKVSNKPKRPIVLDLNPQANLAQNAGELVANVDILLTSGTMSPGTRQVITEAVEALTPAADPKVRRERAKMAIYLTLVSPDYAIQR